MSGLGLEREQPAIRGTVMSKCFDMSPSDSGRTCQKQGHSCLTFFRRASRAGEILLRHLRVGCEGVRLVKRVHNLFGGVHKLATALKEVEEVREEVQETKDKCGDQEDEENGGLEVEEKRSSHAWMI